jgi:hypothetical protein
MAEKFIAKAIEHPGYLHRALNVPEGEKIPESKIMKAKHSSNEHMAKAAHLAETLKSFHR